MTPATIEGLEHEDCKAIAEHLVNTKGYDAEVKEEYDITSGALRRVMEIFDIFKCECGRWTREVDTCLCEQSASYRPANGLFQAGI